MTKTAVVILNYNGKTYLEKFLPSVVTNSLGAQVIIADNASTDDSITFLKENYPNLTLIVLPENLGFTGGYNSALKQVDAEYFVLLNSDVEVTPGWLQPMETFLDKHLNYAACQPKIKDFNNPEIFEYAGASGGFIDFLGYPYCRGRILDHLENDHGQYDESIDIFWSSGACMMIRSTMFWESGGFDNDFFAHMEEIDLCWRLSSLGYKVKSIPQSVVYHVGGGTLDKTSPFKTYLNFRNGLSLLLKNLPYDKLLLKFPVRVLLDWVAALKFLLEGKPKHSLAVLKAHISTFINFRRTLKKRTITSTAPKSKLMIFEYYLRGNKKFSELQ
ncbi:glycosyltransferase family 2 protein [Ekhidna sp.]|uniref:glycosyltransferase family 2 protein n=1 Tax=Ekhidna sp. TaxID=2608089 RepID=UPI003CCBBB34